MKRGFEDPLRRQPSEAWRNRDACMACLARDQAALLDRMVRIGTATDPDRWGRNPTCTIETCRRRAARQ